MKKHTLFLGRTDQGVFAQGLFSGALEKTAGVPGPGWETADELKRFIRTLGREERKKNCYVLVNALGGGEWFGSNINADYFPWNALTHDGPDYGYKTFLNAHAFAHHVNKDPERAFGVPDVSVLNPRMKRVELIIKLDREKAKRENADGIITRIDNGEFPDVSMGCRVPFDVCSICGNQSKTRDDYCVHMRPDDLHRTLYGPNKILPDGRKIYVINTVPRFFDISFVFIGADKTAKVMAKLASRGAYVCLGSVCTLSQDGEDDLDVAGRAAPLTKVAAARDPGRCENACTDCDPCSTDKLAAAFGVKQAAEKVSAMEKVVPVGSFSMRNLPALESSEADLPPAVLDRLAEYPLSNSTGAATQAGMVLKPREFQRIVLIRMGERDLADDLDGERKVFRPVHRFDDAGKPEIPAIPELLRLLLPFLQERSAYGPPISIRILRLRANGNSKKTLPTGTAVEHPLLDKISAAYNGYRRHALMKLSQAREEVASDSKSMEALLGNGLVKMFSKTASTDQILTSDSMAYFMSAHLSDRGLLSTTAVGAVAYPRLREELSA